MYERIISPLLALALVASASGQQQRPQTQNNRDGAPQDEVVKVTTNLVQIDVVVTDKSGRQIADLGPEDFEVSEDGKRVPITNFSYVNAAETPAAEAGASGEARPAREGQRGAPVAPATLRREQVRRTVALVVDDLGLSFESMGFVRDALRKFVDEQMQPTDVVAVFRTSAGVGALQQFTSDKRLLHAAIERVRWYPAGRGNVSRYAAFNEPSMGADSRDSVQFTQEAEESRAGLYSVGTFGAASAVVSGLADMPGRKSVVLISEAFRLFSAQGRNIHLIDAMRRLTTQANAASVTIYTMDASGLQTDAFTAEDQPGAPAYMISPELFAAAGREGSGVSSLYLRPNPPPRTLDRADASGIAAQAERESGAAFRRLNALMDQRRVEREEAHTVLSYLASKTGGLFMRNRNDLGAAMRRIMDDQRGYYLIGYRPNLSEDERDARAARMRNITVKLKRPGAEMRTRAGYFGVPDADRRAKPRTREGQLAAALLSPFASGDVRVRLTSLFGTEPAPGPPQPYVRALLHVDARDLSFKEEPGGARSTELEVVGVVVGDNGQIVGQDSLAQPVRAANEEEYERLRREGLIYVLNFPVKRAGSYQLRVAARESASERLGAASHFVEVPNLGAGRLALSGVVLSGVEGAAAAQPNAQSGPAVRRLRQGQMLDYRYYIHNAKVGADGRPQLQTQMRLFRDNQPVFTGKLLPFDASKQTDAKRLGAAGRVRIGPELTPGQYLLQVTVTDALATGRAGTATQWIDFEIVE